MSVDYMLSASLFRAGLAGRWSNAKCCFRSLLCGARPLANQSVWTHIIMMSSVQCFIAYCTPSRFIWLCIRPTIVKYALKSEVERVHVIQSRSLNSSWKAKIFVKKPRASRAKFSLSLKKGDMKSLRRPPCVHMQLPALPRPYHIRKYSGFFQQTTQICALSASGTFSKIRRSL